MNEYLIRLPSGPNALFPYAFYNKRGPMSRVSPTVAAFVILTLKVTGTCPTVTGICQASERSDVRSEAA
jgi:hypothetical protein